MKRILVTLISLAVTCIGLYSQEPKSEEERIKEMYESIDNDVTKMTDNLNLADWQVFKVDSTLTHDVEAMVAEMKALSGRGVTNTNLYIAVQDKWAEATYLSYQTFLTEEQWAKYLKSGAARAKKARDKRIEKAARDEAKLKAKLKK